MKKTNETQGPDIFELQLDELDRHELEQPQLAKQYGDQLAAAKDEMDRAKNKLDAEKAELMIRVAGYPEDFEIAKPTGALIDAAVTSDKIIRALNEDLLDCKADVGMLSSMMSALDGRKYALQDLVKLHGQEYFAAVQVTREDAEKMQDTTKGAIRRRIAASKKKRDEERANNE